MLSVFKKNIYLPEYLCDLNMKIAQSMFTVSKYFFAQKFE